MRLCRMRSEARHYDDAFEQAGTSTLDKTNIRQPARADKWKHDD